MITMITFDLFDHFEKNWKIWKKNCKFESYKFCACYLEINYWKSKFWKIGLNEMSKYSFSLKGFPGKRAWKNIEKHWELRKFDCVQLTQLCTNFVLVYFTFYFYSILVQIVQGYVQKTIMSYLGTSPIRRYKTEYIKALKLNNFWK